MTSFTLLVQCSEFVANQVTFTKKILPLCVSLRKILINPSLWIPSIDQYTADGHWLFTQRVLIAVKKRFLEQGDAKYRLFFRERVMTLIYTRQHSLTMAVQERIFLMANKANKYCFVISCWASDKNSSWKLGQYYLAMSWVHAFLIPSLHFGPRVFKSELFSRIVTDNKRFLVSFWKHRENRVFVNSN